MRILFFTSKPIYPAVDGGCFASQQFLKCLLHANMDVKYVTLSTDKHPFDNSKFPKEVAKKIAPVDYFVDTAIHPLSAFAALFNSSSYNADRFYHKEVADLLTALIQNGDFDGIVFDSLYTLPYFEDVKAIFKGKMMVRTHNVEFKLWEQYAKEASVLKKWYLNRLAKDLKRFELSALKKVHAIFSISQDDSEVFRNNGITTSIVEIPVSVPTALNAVETTSNKLFFLGSMDWQPNIQSARRLMEMLPEFRKNNAQLELHVAGAKSDEVLSGQDQPGLHVHGFVDSVVDFMSNHGVLAAPIQFASGVRIKFLEAMAMGIPVVTTPEGALGIDYTGKNCLFVVNSDEEFIRAIAELSANPEKRKEIGRNAIHYIEKNHNIDAISQKIVETFEANT